MSNNMTHEIRQLGKQICGESRNFGPSGKESWQWNKNAQIKIRIKKKCLKKIDLRLKMLKLENGIIKLRKRPRRG